MARGPATQAKIDEVLLACERYGTASIIALAGVPGTGKSHVAAIAAQEHAGEPTRVKEIQFHQSFTYEEFMEGLRIDRVGAVEPTAGVFLDWNEHARTGNGLRYVLLIEEFTRANLGAVLGELLTYVEHRERRFETLFSRTPTAVSRFLTIMATFNPVDRSALSMDDALLRRIRIIDFLPDPRQLEEMLMAPGRRIPPHVIAKLQALFDACERTYTDYAARMPFGHGIFSEVMTEDDLYPLWHQRLVRMIRRPTLDPHAYAETIEEAYPWKNDPTFHLPIPGQS